MKVIISLNWRLALKWVNKSGRVNEWVNDWLSELMIRWVSEIVSVWVGQLVHQWEFLFSFGNNYTWTIYGSWMIPTGRIPTTCVLARPSYNKWRCLRDVSFSIIYMNSSLLIISPTYIFTYTSDSWNARVFSNVDGSFTKRFSQFMPRKREKTSHYCYSYTKLKK